MKRIKEGEEFQLGTQIYVYSINDGKLTITPINKGKTIKQEFIPPTLDKVITFFKSKGYTQESASKFHEYYSAGDWKDSNSKPVKNWKQKAILIWFKPENKETKQQKESQESKFLF